SRGNFGWITARVGDLNHPTTEQSCTMHIFPRERRSGYCASPCFGALGITCSNGRGINPLAIPKRKTDEGVRKELQPALYNGLEYRLSVAGRSADDLKHIGSRRLLLKRFAQFVKQSCVLDGYDGLGGEGLPQHELFFP